MQLQGSMCVYVNHLEVTTGQDYIFLDRNDIHNMFATPPATIFNRSVLLIQATLTLVCLVSTPFPKLQLQGM